MKLQARHPTLLFSSVGKEYFSQLLTAVGGEELFRSKYLPVAERLAVTVQDLPLDRACFAFSGGALKFGLFAGLTALRLADGVIFDPSATAQRRMIVEPQFRYAAWCATLACVPLIVHHNSHIKVNDQPWSFAHSPSNLFEACDKSGDYEVNWRSLTPQAVTPVMSAIFLSDFFYPGQFQDLDPEVLVSMCESINPGLEKPTGEKALSRVVRVAQEKVKAAEDLRLSKVFASCEVTNSGVISDYTVSVPSQLQDTAKPTGPADGTATKGGSKSSVQAAWTVQTSPQVNSKVSSWIRALISEPATASQFQFLPTLGLVDVTIEQLKFGGSAKAMYDLLEAEELVESKVPGKTVRLKKDLTAFVIAEFKRQGVSHA